MSDKAAETVSAKPSMLPTLLVSGFITVIVLAETFIFFFLVPSADDVAALAEKRLIDKVEASMKDDGEEQIDSRETIKEFSLGEYNISFTPPGSDRSYNVIFRLFGTVKDQDAEKLEQLYKEREGRFRNRMMLEVRNATMDELTENQLGLIQRRILATSNDILGGKEPILLGVGFNDYQLVEE